ncbi:hypothetical protein ACFXAE_11825 [Streptomyces sp. NPDC059454]|uniref:hypothetical protein n=1 Tax=Streptomyces sp. NPDC059454 TaxID=3346836 RepID=UPI00369C4AA1
MPRPLSRALLLVHALFACTVLGGPGLLLTAMSFDAVNGALLARVAYAAAPGALGWWPARRTWRGGAGSWAGLIAALAGGTPQFLLPLWRSAPSRACTAANGTGRRHGRSRT